MARKPQIQIPGEIYHVMNRGDRREAIFSHDEDRLQPPAHYMIISLTDPFSANQRTSVVNADGSYWVYSYDSLVKMIIAKSIFLVSLILIGSLALAQENIPSSSYNVGIAYLNSGHWDKAINEFSAVLKSNSTNILAYEYRGCAYFAKGDFDDAVNDFTEAIKLDARNANIYLNRASAYRAKGKLDYALSDIRVCLRLDPSNGSAYKCRGAIYTSQREFNKALNDWNDGLRLAPDDASAFAVRGYVWFMMGRYKNAVEDYRKAIQINPSMDLPYNNYAWLRATCPKAAFRDGKEAIELAKKACEMSRWDTWRDIGTLAAAYAEVGDFEKAVKFQRQAIDLKRAAKGEYEEDQARLLLYQKCQPYRDKVN